MKPDLFSFPPPIHPARSLPPSHLVRLAVRNKPVPVYADDELFREMNAVAKRLDWFPTSPDFDRLSNRCWSTLNRRFGQTLHPGGYNVPGIRKKSVLDQYRTWLDTQPPDARPKFLVGVPDDCDPTPCGIPVFKTPVDLPLSDWKDQLANLMELERELASHCGPTARPDQKPGIFRDAGLLKAEPPKRARRSVLVPFLAGILSMWSGLGPMQSEQPIDSERIKPIQCVHSEGKPPDMLHRRDALLRLGTVGLGSLTLPRLLQAEQAQRRATTDGRLSSTATAKSCILVYLWGGPPQQETFDPKLDAPEGIRSQFGATDTVVPGISICDQLPQIARHTDKLAIIRSYTHPSNIHEIGVNYTLTGRFKDGLAVPRNMRNRNDFPMVGSVVSYFSPPGALPAAVTIPRPIGHDGVIYTGTYSGFLGPRYDPLELQAPAEVNAPPMHSLDLPKGLDALRVQSRVGLLSVLDQTDRKLQSLGDRGAVAGLESSREQAYRMLLSPNAKGAFDLSRENENLRERYGRNEYGEAFLLARRLVEAGVRLVTLVWYYVAPKDGNVLNVWDNHGGTASINGITGHQMLKEYYCLPSLDRGYSALIEDLSQRGLLDETLVAMMGEFGRTPKINPQAGRDHWGPCQSVVLAGGGIQGGQVYGASDRQAAYPTQNPVSPEDYIATIHHALGIPLDAEFHDQLNRPHRVCDGTPLVNLFA